MTRADRPLGHAEGTQVSGSSQIARRLSSAHANVGFRGSRWSRGMVVAVTRADALMEALETQADPLIPELVENRRRSVALLLPPGAPALNRDEALELLGQLGEALRWLRDLERGDEVDRQV
jgi:hypothetical protein